MDKQQQIINAAAQSFSQYGYKATTMEQVAKIAQVGKGTVYLYFSNKEKLLKEIVRSLAVEMRMVADQHIQASEGFVERFDAALYAILQFREQHDLMVKLSLELNDFGTPIVKEVLDSFEQEICVYIADKVRLAIEKEEIRSCDPEITAFLMYKMYINLIHDWQKHHSPISRERAAALIRLYFIEGLQP
ncbi:TetR/AcrR family transcriptional regulator [Gracilibacillus timonensis]|uniref:TetR/AcrR family transcriptional regulator n=1 Tax=Gracilibacillus timonensis TaxID=1816696 RepID=UPI0008255051|nr:TetR/AcrR family transcriptional regulator [Gracilibacillus timonensis]